MSFIRNYIWNFVKKFFGNDIQNEIHKELVKVREEHDKNRVEIEFNTISYFVGKPVICFSNEWANPLIGFGKYVKCITKANSPVLCMHNYLDDREYLVFGIVYHFTEQRFNALFKLNPFERCAFIFNRMSSEDFNKEKKYHN